MSQSEPRFVTASFDIAAEPAVLFELIADPAQQPRWDGNDNLAEAAAGQRIRAVGEVFETTLTNGNVRENHVVEYAEGRRIAWRPADPGAEPAGHLWRWEFEPLPGGGTRVTHSYDWTELTDPRRLERARGTTSDWLLASLHRLAALAERSTSPAPESTEAMTASPVATLAPTGTLRAVINLGNPVLAGGTAAIPTGVTVDLARELATRLAVPLELRTVTGAKAAFEALAGGEVDLAFLAEEPARAERVTFTAAYLLIEGVYAVPQLSGIGSAAEVDRPGVRIGVKEGSAYDLFLTRTLQHAELVRGTEASQIFAEQELEVLAGIRQPITSYAAAHELRVLAPEFMQIQQAIAAPRGLPAAAAAYLADFLVDAKASGFLADALARAGQTATIAP